MTESYTKCQESAKDALPLYAFHSANIHEQRIAAYVARAVPMGSMALCCILVCVGIAWKIEVLLGLCAILNISVWLFITSMAFFGILGMFRIHEASAWADTMAKDPALINVCTSVTNIVVYPNYKEDEEMLAETLRSLSETTGSKHFIVVLAMEEREGPSAVEKALRLECRFAEDFLRIFSTYHPANLEEIHLDGSSNAEVAGKASNLKWAVSKVYEYVLQNPEIDINRVVLTVSDADVLFHPAYFQWIATEYLAMQESPGEQHKWTLWQAPQLPFRNYYESPAPSRIWGYISSVYEFGGVSSLYVLGQHMVFSAYSVSLRLAVDGNLWDGDVIAEDHHAYLKAFFYSTLCSSTGELLGNTGDSTLGQGCRPQLRVRPVMLPAKSTSVVSAEGYWQSCVERWHQATRHCQGVSELSYSVLVLWDMLATLPFSMYNLHFITMVVKVMFRPFMTHIIPNCQGIALGALTVYWVVHHRSVPNCPDRIWMASSDGETLLCGLAGAWALTWPVVVPLFLVSAANLHFIWYCFLAPATTGKNTVWHGSDGGVVPTLGSKVLTVLLTIIVDNTLFLAPVMFPYGLLAEFVGCWNVLRRGNHFNYVTAAKAISACSGSSYGTMAVTA